jgi:ribulose-phosphate 3-epimerase
VLPELDMVLLMSVNPGFGGQKYIPYVTGKVRDLRKKLDALGLSIDLEVDGGITTQNVEEVKEAGANVFVAGSAVFRGDIGANVREFQKILTKNQ